MVCHSGGLIRLKFLCIRRLLYNFHDTPAGGGPVVVEGC